MFKDNFVQCFALFYFLVMNVCRLHTVKDYSIFHKNFKFMTFELFTLVYTSIQYGINMTLRN